MNFFAAPLLEVVPEVVPDIVPEMVPELVVPEPPCFTHPLHPADAARPAARPKASGSSPNQNLRLIGKSPLRGAGRRSLSATCGRGDSSPRPWPWRTAGVAYAG